MSGTIGITPDVHIAAREELARQVEFRRNAGPQQPEPTPRALRWQDIAINAEVFQHRSLTEEAAEEHIKTLAKAIHRGPRGPRQAHLEPITVWWDGREWICVDGHHSLAAYQGLNHPQPVPVKVLRGASLDEAIRVALEGNAKDKLPYTRRCKSEAAWRLTVAGGYSKADTARLTETAERTVSNMREAIRELAKAHPEVAPAGLTWAQVRHWKQHRQLPGDGDEMDIDTKRQKQAERVYRKIAQHIKDASRDTLWRVFELHKPGLMAEIVAAYEAAQDPEQDPDPSLLEAVPEDF